jgi:hypothetical protein
MAEETEPLLGDIENMGAMYIVVPSVRTQEELDEPDVKLVIVGRSPLLEGRVDSCSQIGSLVFKKEHQTLLLPITHSKLSHFDRGSQYPSAVHPLKHVHTIVSQSQSTQQGKVCIPAMDILM